MDRTYLDYAATTPLDPRVLDAMSPYFTEVFANPSSIHFFGQLAERAIEMARKRILSHFQASEYDVIFTSGGSESDNLAIRGVVSRQRDQSSRAIVISPLEHRAVSNTAVSLEEGFGVKIKILRVDNYGFIDTANLEESITEPTALVSVIHGNNEIGTVNNILEIAKICNGKGIPFHSDGVQAAAHLDVKLDGSNIDFYSIGAHKFYGPKGTGALFVKKGTGLLPQITGGNQEGGLRSGTSNVAGIVGMAEALDILGKEGSQLKVQLTKSRDYLINRVLDEISGSYLTGHQLERLPNHASFAFEGIQGNDLVIALDMRGYAVSSGSACKVGNSKPSEILLAMGFSLDLALGGIRISLGRDTQDSQITAFVDVLAETINNMRRTGIRKAR